VAGAATTTDLFRALDTLGIVVRTTEHPAVFTVEESQAVRRLIHDEPRDDLPGDATAGDGPGGHCKCLFLRDKKGRYLLVAALESTRVDLKALRRRLITAGYPLQTLSFASAERLGQVMGIEPGTVTPFALLNNTARDVRVILDPALFDHGHVHFHPLRNTATCAIWPADLVRFIEAQGHAPLRLPLTADDATTTPTT